MTQAPRTSFVLVKMGPFGPDIDAMRERLALREDVVLVAVDGSRLEVEGDPVSLPA